MSKNIIVACYATHLSENEKSLFKELNPLGFILFARNIESPQQVKSLTDEFKHVLDRDDVMVLIDQEGGRVSRLPEKHWRVPPCPTVFAKLYAECQQSAKRACYLNALLTGLELKTLGINVNCAPMLDVPQNNAATIISERALGNNPQQVLELGRQIVEGLKAASVAPVIKHIPGHGRATNDSHLSLPFVDADISQLRKSDFVPFTALASEKMAMSAHIVFEEIDNKHAATVSQTVINRIIRDDIGFEGLLMSDDINMQALSGNVAQRAQACLQAGCDVALHCSGDFTEIETLLKVASPLKGVSKQRANEAEALAFSKTCSIVANVVEEELNQLLKK